MTITDEQLLLETAESVMRIRHGIMTHGITVSAGTAIILAAEKLDAAGYVWDPYGPLLQIKKESNNV